MIFENIYLFEKTLNQPAHYVLVLLTLSSNQGPEESAHTAYTKYGCR